MIEYRASCRSCSSPWTIFARRLRDLVVGACPFCGSSDVGGRHVVYDDAGA